jgi:hypothetical protein
MIIGIPNKANAAKPISDTNSQTAPNPLDAPRKNPSVLFVFEEKATDLNFSHGNLDLISKNHKLIKFDNDLRIGLCVRKCETKL